MSHLSAGTEETFRSAPTPEAAFDALYLRAAPHLIHQTHLLTGRRARAFESVEYAFRHAWQHWPEVAVDPDPTGWVRAHAYEYALSPWHHFREGVGEVPPAPDDPVHRALLCLAPRHRRTLLMCDGLGLDVAQVAAETEASDPVVRSRLLNARSELAAQVPELATAPDELRARMRTLAGATSTATVPTATSVRAGSDRRLALLTRTVVGAVAALVGLVSLSIATGPDQHQPPQESLGRLGS
ncbi:sigma factor-like helix-turn-helix DNA-binding protein [Streptomyces sp. NPDC058045]|uniref:sigma factor-like helix-turn-helix DNA-binding protein n=1 Tax=Streptomyces sp. NPDC058045 TaxID=3346311 RepID=UPI0036E87C11